MSNNIKRFFAVALTVVLSSFAGNSSAQTSASRPVAPGAARTQTSAPRAAANGTAANGTTRLQSTKTTANGTARLPSTPTANGTSAANGTATPAKKSDGTEFIIPENATAEQLLAQANALTTTETVFETQEEYSAWIEKMLATSSKIADKVLGMKTTDEIFIQAVSLKGQTLCYQASLDPAALAKLNAFATALEKNARVQQLEEGRDAAIAFRGVYLQTKIAEIAERTGTAAEMKSAVLAVSAFIAKYPETADMTSDLVYPVAVLAANLKDPSLPGEIWTPIRAQLVKAGDADSLAAAEQLDGAIRFSELDGQTFEWFGRTLDGIPFDPKTVQGKVVVLDFWASCDSCKEVHAELKKLYEKYGASGLEIVGYNLDADAKETQTYLQENAIPWTILSDRQTVDAKEKSLARYYGIAEIPTLILIGGDGKVAAVDVDLETLAATLEQTFAAAGKANAVEAASQNAAQTVKNATAAETSKTSTPVGTAQKSGKTPLAGTGAAGAAPTGSRAPRPVSKTPLK